MSAEVARTEPTLVQGEHVTFVANGVIRYVCKQTDTACVSFDHYGGQSQYMWIPVRDLEPGWR